MGVITVARNNKTKGLGYIPLPKEKIDNRDFLFSAQFEDRDIPTVLDLRPKCGPIMDQERTNSCVGHSIASIADMRAVWDKKIFRMFSPLFAYWSAREYQGWTEVDKGAYIFDGVKGYASKGISPDKLHPFKLGVFVKPDMFATSFAKWFITRPGAYYKITDANMDDSFVDDVKVAIYAGYTVIGGIWLHSEFYSPKAGVVIPQEGSSVHGAHALHWVGFVDLEDEQYQLALEGKLGLEMILASAAKFPTKKGFLLFKNSWGPLYGNMGYGLIPYDYVDDNGNDFWAVK